MNLDARENAVHLLLEDTVRQLLDRGLFLAWLKSKNPAANVGFASDAERCPLARYLAEHGVLCPQVTVPPAQRHPVIRVGGRGGVEVTGPQWAWQFGRRVDRLGGEGEVRQSVPVRAYHARQILESLP